MDSSRIKQINELINHKLSYILMDMFAGEIFSITEVRTSPDLSSSKIYVSILKNGALLIDKMNGRASEIRGELTNVIQIRHTPQIRFYVDETEANAEKIDQLFKKI